MDNAEDGYDVRIVPIDDLMLFDLKHTATQRNIVTRVSDLRIFVDVTKPGFQFIAIEFRLPYSPCCEGILQDIV